MSVGTGAIQTDAGVVSTYADGIGNGYNAVGKDQATKDSLSEYAASGTIQSHIDTEYSVSEQAAVQAIEFVQVLHGIHEEFQLTDTSIAQSISQSKSTPKESNSPSGRKKDTKLFSEGTQ